MAGFSLSIVQIWLAIGVILIGAEIMTTTFFLLWPAVAAFVVAIISWVVPEFSFFGQLLVFAFVSAVLLVPGRRLVLPYIKNGHDTQINNRMAQLIGQPATIVYIDGATLRAK